MIEKSLFKIRHRIVVDCHLGYEAQYRRWWMPFYIQGGKNTHRTLDAAEEYAKKRFSVKYIK